MATALSDTSIKLDWTNVAASYYDGHSIERSDDGITYVEVDTALAGTNTFTDTGLTSETQYFYRVRAYKGTDYSDYSAIDSDITLVTPLLDLYTGAIGAYSLRLLDNDYAGACIKVRRSSDDAELDIGFVNGYLDDITLLTFAGVGDAFIVTWYDQSGNGRNATQTTPANQPQIIDSGEFIVMDGLRVVSFNGTTQGFKADAICTDVSGTNVPLSTFAACYMKNNTGGPTLLTFGNTGMFGYPERLIYAPYDATTCCFYKRNDDASTTVLKRGTTGNEHSYLLSAIDAVLGEIYIDGEYATIVGDQAKDLRIGPVTVNTCSIGYLRRTSISSYFNGGLNELILYASDKTADRVGIETNINSALGSPFFV